MCLVLAMCMQAAAQVKRLEAENSKLKYQVCGCVHVWVCAWDRWAPLVSEHTGQADRGAVGAGSRSRHYETRWSHMGLPPWQ